MTTEIIVHIKDQKNPPVLKFPARCVNCGNSQQTTRAQPCSGTGNRPVRQRNRLRLRHADDAKARAAQRRINAKNDCVGVEFARDGFNHGRRFADCAVADALFHPLELLQRDAHARSLPACSTFQKEKTSGRRKNESERIVGADSAHGAYSTLLSRISLPMNCANSFGLISPKPLNRVILGVGHLRCLQ